MPAEQVMRNSFYKNDTYAAMPPPGRDDNITGFESAEKSFMARNPDQVQNDN